MQTTHSKHISSSLELEPLGDELELGPRGDPPLAIAEYIPACCGFAACRLLTTMCSFQSRKTRKRQHLVGTMQLVHKDLPRGDKHPYKNMIRKHTLSANTFFENVFSPKKRPCDPLYNDSLFCPKFVILQLQEFSQRKLPVACSTFVRAAFSSGLKTKLVWLSLKKQPCALILTLMGRLSSLNLTLTLHTRKLLVC
jgi:hypothetical protein